MGTIRPPSAEQTAILDSFAAGNNIIVDAVAGSGKTTLVLHMALREPSNNFLVLSYNRYLRNDTVARCRANDIYNIHAYTIHSFASKIYRDCIRNDVKLAKHAGARITLSSYYDCIIIDEAQDLVPLYFQFICGVIRENGARSAKCCFIGDQMQSIYDYKGSDYRFLTLCDKLLGLPFVRLSLSTSFRYTKEMAAFANHCLGYERIVGFRESGHKPRIITCKWRSHKSFDEKVNRAIQKYGVRNIAILAPSIKPPRFTDKQSPLTILINYISDNLGHNVYVQRGDTEPNRDAANGKLSVLTYHGSKGIERKCVFVLGFDRSYYAYYSRAEFGSFINVQYVAITRASDRLYVVQNDGDELPIIESALAVGVAIGDGQRAADECQPIPRQTIAITDLVQHLPMDCAVYAQGKIDEYIARGLIAHIEAGENAIQLSITTKGRGTHDQIEEISDITGSAITQSFARSHGRMAVCERAATIARTYGMSIKYDHAHDAVQYAACIDARNTGRIHRIR